MLLADYNQENIEIYKNHLNIIEQIEDDSKIKE
jgi:hypothetical protein